MTSGATSITGIITSVYAPSSNTLHSASGSDTYDSGIHTLYGWATASSDGRYYPAGSDTIAIRPSNWSWYTSELNAFNKVVGYGLSNLSYTRWNAFINKINEFRAYKGLSDVSSAAYMTSGDKQLTATRFNLVRLAIDSMYSTGITDRVAGDPVYGSYFITLRDSLNSIT